MLSLRRGVPWIVAFQFPLLIVVITLGSVTACGGGASAPATSSTTGVQLKGTLIASPTGSGADCSLAQPCSLTAARDRVRTLNRDMKADIVVYLRGGVYALGSTFDLDTNDSGNNGYRVSYQAYAGETPVLSGGVSISGWSLYDAGKNIYRAPAPAGLSTRQMYVNGVRAQRARGALNPPGFSKTADGYLAPDAGMASWRNPGDIEFVYLYQWKNYRCRVAAISGNAVTMDRPCWTLVQAPQQYFTMGLPSWIENAYELLNAPGQWYHDRSAGYIYYIPRANEDLSRAEAIVPMLETLLRVTGTPDNPVHDITFKGITFAHATWLKPSSSAGYPSLQAGQMLTGNPADYNLVKTPGNVSFQRVQNVVLERNVFTHLGAAGLMIEAGSKYNQIIGNVFKDISGSAVVLGDINQPQTTDAREITKDNLIRNNYISQAGQEYFDAVGVFVGYTDDTIVDHNELDNLPYTGISVGWGWGGGDPSVAKNNQITHNRVHHVMQRLEDGGMIYTLGAQPGSIISGNWLSSQTLNYAGIYLDQGSQFFTIDGNVIASAPYWFVHQAIQPPAQNNTVLTNYADAPFFSQGQGLSFNVTSVTSGAWPAAAQNIMNNAGLEAAFQAIRGAGTHVEAEAYNHGGPNVGYAELTPGNAGGVYRGDDVDLYPGPSCSNDYVVGYTQTGEWLAYSIHVPKTGFYDFNFAVATPDAGGAIQLVVDGVTSAGSVAVPVTGDWLVFRPAALGGVYLTQGFHTVYLVFTGGFSFDYFTYSAQ